MEEQKTNYFVKFLHKPYSSYCSVTKEKLRSEQCLWIFYIKKPKDDRKIYSYYIEKIKGLSQKERTIIFYGVPIRLSKQRFAILCLLINDGDIANYEYPQISELCNNKKINKGTIDDDLKSFISKFKKHVIEKWVEYTGIEENAIAEKFDNLVYYEKSWNNYEIKTNFKILKKEFVKKQKN